jgi:hypothetical protein
MGLIVRALPCSSQAPWPRCRSPDGYRSPTVDRNFADDLVDDVHRLAQTLPDRRVGDLAEHALQLQPGGEQPLDHAVVQRIDRTDRFARRAVVGGQHDSTP